MAKLKVGPKPSEEIVAAANAITHVIDARGRKIGLRKPTLLSQYKLVEFLGDTAKNEAFMSMLMPIVMVAELDGEVIHPPRSRLELDALITRIDDDGLTAIASYLAGEGEGAPAGDFADRVGKS